MHAKSMWYSLRPGCRNVLLKSNACSIYALIMSCLSPHWEKSRATRQVRAPPSDSRFPLWEPEAKPTTIEMVIANTSKSSQQKTFWSFFRRANAVNAQKY